MKLRLTRSGARTCGGIGLGGEALLGPAGPSDALVAHEPGHLVPADVDGRPAAPPSSELAPAVDGVVVLPELHQSCGPSSASRTARAEGGRALAS